MISVKCNQGSPEWHQARAGVITASMISEVRKVVDGLTDQQQLYVDALRSGKTENEAKEIAEYKSKPRMTDKLQAGIDGEKVGDYSDAAKAYAFRLAVERISGQPLDEADQFQTYAMKRGNELEPAARLCHETKYGLLVEQTGLVLSDDHFFGASADGLIDDDGGSEYKCLINPVRMRQLWIDNDTSEFTDQIQACMWISGRKWWHLCMYSPALESIGKELFVIEIQRDDEYIAEMEADLIAFNELVERFKQELIDAELPLAPAAELAA